MRFLPYQRAGEPPLTPELAEACARAVHVLCPDGTVLRAGRAVLFIARELGWRRCGAVLSFPPMVWCVELAYSVVARHRHLFGRCAFRRR